MELMIFPYAAVLCAVAALSFRLLGDRIGYTVFFAILAVVILMKTL